jgi:hypothetical protein
VYKVFSSCHVTITKENKMKAKITIVSLLVTLIAVSTAYAASLTITGKWAGPAFANTALDLNNDGVPGRQFQVNAYDQIAFTAIEGAVDSTLVAFPGQPGNTCPNPAVEFEIEPLGKLIFRGHRDGAVFVDVNSTPHLCFNPAAPAEVLQFTVSGGTGIYAGRTGTGSAVLNDTVLISAGGVVPLLTNTRGSFTLTLN